jgi:hypothetical protein
MLKIFLMLTAAACFALAGAGPASAFLPGQSPMIAASQESSNAIQVKKKFKFKKMKMRPPGWDRGLKIGWRGANVPPGQRHR